MNDFTDAGVRRPLDYGDEGPTGVAARGQQLAERFQQGAEYFRNLEPDEIRDEIEAGIRARPLLSVALAVCAGFVVGRLIRR